MPPLALVALGANLTNGTDSPARTLKKSLLLLGQKGVWGMKTSRLFTTPAFPAGSGPDYVNAAASFRWSETPEALLALLHAVETELGRVRGARWGARVIDLDLVALGDAVRPDAATQSRWAALPPDRAAVDLPDRLILPHPRLAERSFVLVPLADVAPDWWHPVTGQDVAAMLAARPDAERAEIRPVPWPGQDMPSTDGPNASSGLVFPAFRR
ncbi:2-amino-4-hydroxy-6-hydroxymethyldihydropteridine diphosphokinase [Roseicyclus marinus]|uniref:2-amino-4-hydroxy-6- hydroxymethyldihydropteridine diphosphokinase n=1 Tax=Roseicyclus marinus TaxID=2161673 RepID=UPI00240ECE90|nr:2-amino-4-hydroxy-6-hydroxymethyldihydropteridine diphosphokinase [Roseicyclus marinus]MDG3042636.1 2-amino-4-hydroxy-6-hydroxymethyldihydropteridine diphosphokinase [Roseicyclus marinus]